MPRIQYASTITPPPPTVSVITGNITVAKAGTYYLFLYCRNRAGVTQFSNSASVAIAAGQGIKIILPSAIRPTAAVIEHIGVVLSAYNTPGAGCVVATYPGNGALPAEIDLTRDEHLEIGKNLAAIADLPTGQNLVHGMRRYVDQVSKILEYNNYSSTWDICKPQIFNPYVASSLEEGGADRDIADIQLVENILPVEYVTNTELVTLSNPVIYWLVNDTSVNIPQGTRIRIAVATDVFDVVADDFKGLMSLRCLGDANLVTGELNTAIATGSFDYQGDQATNLLLTQPLASNHAYVLEIRMKASDYLLNNRVMQGDIAKIYPRFAVNYAAYNPTGKITGDLIIAESDRRRILPGGKALDLIAKNGSGTIKSYNFDQVGEQVVPGLVSNAAEQIVVITNNGTCYVADSIPDTGAKRAIVSSVDGLGQISSWSSPIALNSSKLLKLTINHPTSIRPDYPDAIAGMTAIFNASKIAVFARPQAGGTILRFDAAIVGTGAEEVTVGGVTTSTLTDLPTVAFSQGLFKPISYSLSTVIASSVFAATNYQIAVAYFYENTVTAISHDPTQGCVPEIAGTFADLFSISQAWNSPVAESAVSAIAQSETYSYQTRRLITGRLIYYNPLSYATHNGITIWKPNWRADSEPGRWETDPSSGLSLDDVIPLILIFGGD
jgi:hypothetical protein